MVPHTNIMLLYSAVQLSSALQMQPNTDYNFIIVFGVFWNTIILMRIKQKQ